jgi:hypothetical protein
MSYLFSLFLLRLLLMLKVSIYPGRFLIERSPRPVLEVARPHRWRCAIAVAAAALALFSATERPDAHQKYSNVTWSNDVGPILGRRCISCHRTDGFAPMSLVTYEEAKQWKAAIRTEVLERRMPPWPAARGFGDFANDRSLTVLEQELIVSWVDGGTPEGSLPATVTPAPALLPDPDLVLQTTVASPVQAYMQHYVLETRTAHDRWVSRWEFRPGNARLVERASIHVGGDGDLGSWVPGDGVIAFPAGTALRLPADSRIMIEVVYRKTSAPETDRSTLALWTTSTTATATPAPRAIHSRTFACGRTTVGEHLTVLSVRPDASAAGASVEVVAHAPTGIVSPMAVVPRFNPVYQPTYWFRAPLAMAGGTVLEVYSPEPACSARIAYVQSLQR